MRRRRFLALTGVAALAGCVGDGSGPAGDTTAPSDETSSSPTTSASSTTGSGTTGAGTTADGTTTTAGTTTAPAGLANESFEDDLAGWTVGTDLPTDPNEPTNTDGERPTVDASATVTTRDASDGSHALELYVEGLQDDGTVWVQQPVDLAGVSTVAVDYLTTKSFNQRANAAVYAGPDRGLAEADFDTSTSIDGHDGTWQTFEYSVDHDGPGVVAVGMSVVWEAEIRNLVDDVRLR